MAASGDPSFAGPTLSLKERTSCDERVSNRQSGVEAGSGGDGPVGKTAVACEPEPLVVVGVVAGLASFNGDAWRRVPSRKV